jgi:hypothetical protein
MSDSSRTLPDPPEEIIIPEPIDREHAALALLNAAADILAELSAETKDPAIRAAARTAAIAVNTIANQTGNDDTSSKCAYKPTIRIAAIAALAQYVAIDEELMERATKESVA